MLIDDSGILSRPEEKFKFSETDKDVAKIVKTNSTKAEKENSQLHWRNNKFSISLEESVKLFHGIQIQCESTAEYSDLYQLGMATIAEYSETTQIGGGNLVKYSEGKQFGLLNFAYDSFAIQTGLICYTKNSTGMQFGLLTIRGDGPWYTRITPLFYMRLKELETTKKAKVGVKKS
ncbi:hypothetical protein HZA97_02160 [Candidatus Woesearchaeota archaeon]|nr:hypothetical protein [Candidatus Woesearchaeota archaeon]